MKIGTPVSFDKLAPKKRSGRKPGPFVAALLSLEVGKAITIDFETPKRTGRVYPVVSRVAKKTGRVFQSRRIDEQTFTIYRIS
jgi:hypothetical protein